MAARHDDTISTELIEDAPFFPAEPYHQKHMLRRRLRVLEPFRAMCPAEQAFANSPAAALANGYVGGHRPPTRLDADASRLGLPRDATEALRAIVEDRRQG